MGKLRIKPNYRRRVLRLPDSDHCKLALSECLQEVDQLLHLLFREVNLEALIIEIHHLLQIGRGPVMEIWRTRGQTSQNETLTSANVAALSSDQGFAGIRGV